MNSVGLQLETQFPLEQSGDDNFELMKAPDEEIMKYFNSLISRTEDTPPAPVPIELALAIKSEPAVSPAIEADDEQSSEFRPAKKRKYSKVKKETREVNNWTPEEDDRLRQAVKVHGTAWGKIAELVFDYTRTAKSVRQRWVYSLDPKITHAPWSAKELTCLKKGVKVYGARNWDAMSTCLFNGTRTGKDLRYTYKKMKK